MRTSDFDFTLPAELIAQTPLPGRPDGRLLAVDGQRLDDRRFTELPALTRPGDVLVFNDTRVIKARLYGRRASGGRIEALVERVLDDREALVFLRFSHAPQAGEVLSFGADAHAAVLGRDGDLFRLRFAGEATVWDVLEAHGRVPLPPYIGRPAGAEDEARYQTVYARSPGAVAAPTAGLHFDDAMLARLREHGVETAFVTLHVGAGTFQPVRVEDLREHRMHTERYVVPAATVEAVARARARGGRVTAVGTTSLRALEAAALAGEAAAQVGEGAASVGASAAPAEAVTPGGAAAAPGPCLRAGEGETDLFITPGYSFRVVDRLLTNFHLPRSTLLMLVSAFAGADATRRAYRHAVEARYRFFSYGDAMLAERSP